MLAERLSADTDAATRRAAAARVTHALRQSARSVDEAFALDLRKAADAIDTRVSAEDGWLPADASDLISAAEAVAAESSADTDAALKERIHAYL